MRYAFLGNQASPVYVKEGGGVSRQYQSARKTENEGGLPSWADRTARSPSRALGMPSSSLNLVAICTVNTNCK